MNTADVYIQRESGTTGIAIAAIVFAIIVGLAASVLPTLIFVGIVIGLIAVAYSAKNPYVGLLFALALVFEVIPEQYQPGVPVGGGKLKPYDVLIVYLAALVWFRTIGTKRGVLQELGLIRWPLLYLSTCLIVSLIYVKYFAPNGVALTEARAQFVWLLVPLIVLGVDSKSRFRGLVVGLIAIGFVIALYVSLESILHVKIMTAARVEPLDQRGNSDVTRSIAGGGTYIIIFSLLLLVNLAQSRKVSPWIALPGCLLLCTGLAVQYGRGAWIGTALGLMFSALIYRGLSGMVRVSIVAVALVSVLLSVASVAKPRMAEALIERAAGIGKEFDSGGSFGFRVMENRHALASIEKHPWLGVGVGGDYKPTMSVVGYFPDEMRYIHNSYLWFPLKMGLWAALIPLSFVIAFFMTAKRGWSRHRGSILEDRGFLGAVCGSFLVPLITSYTQPEWVGAPGISSLSVLIGMALLYVKFGSPFSSSTALPVRK